MDPPPHADYSLSNADEGSSSSLEGQCHRSKMVIANEMGRKRLRFVRSSRDDDPPSSFLPPLSSHLMAPEAHFCCVPSIHVTPPGILRQGRFTTKTTSSLPPRRQYRTLMKVTAAFAGLIGAASYFLDGRQLPPLTDGAYLRKLKGERAAGYGYEGMIAWLNAETSGLPAEERQRVSNIIMHSNNMRLP
jgi:hypothetical protein